MGASCPCRETKPFIDEGCVEGEQQTAIVQQMAALCAKEFAADIAAAPRKTVADVAEAAPETAAEVQEIVVAAAKQGTEVVCSAIDVAVAAGTMVVGFVTENGEVKKVDFKTKKVGFEMAMSGGGCCGPAGQAEVAVKKWWTRRDRPRSWA